ncbi:hypothetical protein [Stieleria mannarensis]|uniref:hypothetical protein n=1 Tax=Stieleria mannarensis TaxID=2755585 RepID=UPI0016040EC3|nr:hypothetical protein [Rhodopirellula sp. JC639]
MLGLGPLGELATRRTGQGQTPLVHFIELPQDKSRTVMNRRFFISLIVVLTVLTAASSPEQQAVAGGNSGWGWAKPMNKRMGAFYTSNKNANFSRNSTKRSTSYRYHHRPPAATKYRPAPPRQILPHRIPQPVAPVPTPAVTPPPIPAAESSLGLKKQVSIWTAGGVAKPPVQISKTKVLPPPNALPGSSAVAAPLPHASTTNRFWQ